jgi:asparagine synthase (glutamine-hydrolysing)
MVTKIRHRGPDDEGIAVCGSAEGGVFLGHTRLSILDLSPAGHQPMSDTQNGNWVTFNGEIYNHPELRRMMSDKCDRWESQSDTETLLRAFSVWGVRCLEKFRGMFAFGIWDQKGQRLLLARDRLGIKPLYYFVGEGFLAFASEVRALLASELIRRQIDEVALWEYLAYQAIPAPRTLIQGVRALPPGAWLSIDINGNVTEGQYWNSLENVAEESLHATEEEAQTRVRELLCEAVESHLLSDVPVGAFLSGGIDSSAIAALIREAGHVPLTFSVVFAEGAFSEAQHARRIARHLNAEHTEILLSESDLLEQLPSALGAMDQPTGDGVNTYVVSKAVRSAGLKVALSGLGGDEFFAGYPSFNRLKKMSPYLNLWARSPMPLRELTARTVKALAGDTLSAAKAASIIESDGSIASVYPLLRQVLTRGQRHSLLSNAWLARVGGASDPYPRLLREAFMLSPKADTFSQISYAESRTYMHDVLLRDTDQMSMAHALEVRVPLLDHKLVEYLMGLPCRYKMSNGTPKRLLVESLGKLLPSEIVHRPKQGFTLPFSPWMKGALRRFCEERLSPERVASRGIMRPERVQKLWSDFLGGRANVSWSRLWVLVVLEEWLERNGVESAL